MRELVIHVGYPKAASTTLQNSLFTQVHEMGLINFIGRAWESGHYGPAQNHADYKSWLRIVRDGGQERKVMSEAHKRMVPNFADDKMNLFSEGLLLLGGSSSTPKNIQDYFGNYADRIRILFVLRAQKSLIMSFYLQRYRRIAQKSFGQYVSDMASARKKGEFGIFYFEEVISRYGDVFGNENITILLFEDIANDLARLSASIGTALKIDQDVVRKLLEGSHQNQTPKDPRGGIVRKTGKRPIATRIRNAFAGAGLVPGLTPAPDRPVIVPPITEAEKALILDTFRISNLRLAEGFGLDENRMRAYGYI